MNRLFKVTVTRVRTLRVASEFLSMPFKATDLVLLTSSFQPELDHFFFFFVPCLLNYPGSEICKPLAVFL